MLCDHSARHSFKVWNVIKSIIVLLQGTPCQDVSEWWIGYKLANTTGHVRHDDLWFSGGVAGLSVRVVPLKDDTQYGFISGQSHFIGLRHFSVVHTVCDQFFRFKFVSSHQVQNMVNKRISNRGFLCAWIEFPSPSGYRYQ